MYRKRKIYMIAIRADSIREVLVFMEVLAIPMILMMTAVVAAIRAAIGTAGTVELRKWAMLEE
jgi:hypothetical protein